MSKTGPNRALLPIHPFIQFFSSLEVMRILGIKIDSSVKPEVEEHRRIVQLLLNSNLFRSTICIISGLLIVFQIFARYLARGFPVARHWVALLQ